MDWSDGLTALYFNKTVIPCGGAAFLLCSMGDALFEQIGLLSRDYSKKYCVFLHNEYNGRNSEMVSGDKSESLLENGKNNRRRKDEQFKPSINV